ncbi:hypothetical protein Tco_0696689 [Tanacetum coccineum]
MQGASRICKGRVQLKSLEWQERLYCLVGREERWVVWKCCIDNLREECEIENSYVMSPMETYFKSGPDKSKEEYESHVRWIVVFVKDIIWRDEGLGYEEGYTTSDSIQSWSGYDVVWFLVEVEYQGSFRDCCYKLSYPKLKWEKGINKDIVSKLQVRTSMVDFRGGPLVVLSIVLMPRVVKSRDEIFSRWGYCDNHDLSRLDNQSTERNRLIGIGFVLNFMKFISFTFGDKEMISVIEAVSL